MKIKNPASLAFYVISAEVIGGLSALITGSYKDFFLIYKKPPLLPPGWLFPLAWTVLYALMGISAYIVSEASAPLKVKNQAFSAYWFQLLLNFLWSIIFFKAELLWGGFAEILLLLMSVIIMTVFFGRINSKAGLLNIPYILWVAFATYLNLATAIIN